MIVRRLQRGFHEVMNLENQARRTQFETDRKALAKIQRAIDGIVAAVEDGLYQPTMKARLAELERQKADIAARLNLAPPELPDVNPNVAEFYRRNVRRLADALAEDPSSHEASLALRSLIGEVVLFPGEKRGEVNATLRGELMGILDFANGGNASRTIVITKGAAGPRNHRDLHTRPLLQFVGLRKPRTLPKRTGTRRRASNSMT